MASAQDTRREPVRWLQAQCTIRLSFLPAVTPRVTQPALLHSCDVVFQNEHLKFSAPLPLPATCGAVVHSPIVRLLATAGR